MKLVGVIGLNVLNVKIVIFVIYVEDERQNERIVKL
jgi:hypothetical protein